MAPSDFNQKIIDEFRSNQGVVGGPFAGAPMLLLHTVGRKSGEERVNPLVYQQVGDAWAVFASYGGAPTNPAWHHNLMAQPDTTIEVGTETIAVRAREANGVERERIWEKQKGDAPAFADYEVRAGERLIPVVILERR